MNQAPQPTCDAIGIGREMVVDFSGAVDVSAIEFRRSVANID